jgi:hypothetical protein
MLEDWEGAAEHGLIIRGVRIGARRYRMSELPRNLQMFFGHLKFPEMKPYVIGDLEISGDFRTLQSVRELGTGTDIIRIGDYGMTGVTLHGWAEWRVRPEPRRYLKWRPGSLRPSVPI